MTGKSGQPVSQPPIPVSESSNKIWDNTCFNTLADTNKTDGNKKETNQCSLNMWKKSITVLELTEGSMNLF